MKAFLMSVAALVAITVVAAFALESIDMSSSSSFVSESGNVRN